MHGYRRSAGMRENESGSGGEREGDICLGVVFNHALPVPTPETNGISE